MIMHALSILKTEKIIKDDVRDGRKAYSKTELGQIFHDFLKNRQIVGILMQDLLRRKLRRVR